MQFATRLDPVWVRRIAKTPPPWGPLGYFVGKRTYCRRLGDRTEQWHEVLERSINAVLDYGGRFTHEEAQDLFLAGYTFLGLPGGRMLWQLGTATVDRLGGDSLLNCYYTNVTGVEDFCFIFDRAMLGCGAGFAADPQSQVVHARRIAHTDGEADWQVPDTREGWTDLVRRILTAYLHGTPSFTYGTRLVRPAGAPILGFGGVASGPGPLIAGADKLVALLTNRAGQRLTSVDVLDIMGILGEIVVSGNVRRTALIALGAAGDAEYLRAKRWDLGAVPNHRAMSNNTVRCDDVGDLTADFWDMFTAEGEQYGLFNTRLSRLDDPTVDGTNACSEISLAHREPCCLSELFVSRMPDLETFVRTARLLYRVNKTALQLPFIDPITTATVRANQRIGIGVTGVCGAKWLDQDYRAVYGALRDEDRRYSRDLGVNTGIKLTTVKPSGTLSLLPGVTPGIHPAYSPYYTRRVRLSADHPLVTAARSHGYHVEMLCNFDGSEDARTAVVSFPVATPKGTTVAADMTAVRQLDLQRRMQRVWSDNAVSVSVYYHQAEVPEIKAYLARHYRDEIKAVSFLQHSGHGFKQAPYEPISEAQYLAAAAECRPVTSVDVGEDYDLLDSTECVGGACPIR